MNKYIEMIQQWILKRDKRERVVLFFISLFLIYYFWNLIFMRGVIAAQNNLTDQINSVKAKRDTVQLQMDTIMKIVNSADFKALIAAEKKMTLQSVSLMHKIANFEPVFVSSKDFSRLTSDILHELNNTVTLISLKEFPDQRWNAPEINTSEILMKNINQHKLAIEFKANYFDTIEYLSRLEQLPWHIYWDSLDYKVTQYPEADVVVQIYVLSNTPNA